MLGVTGAVFAVTMFNEMAGEHHHHEAPAYPYLKIRTKAYPWAASDSNLFDSSGPFGKAH